MGKRSRTLAREHLFAWRSRRAGAPPDTQVDVEISAASVAVSVRAHISPREWRVECSCAARESAPSCVAYLGRRSMRASARSATRAQRLGAAVFAAGRRTAQRRDNGDDDDDEARS